MKVQEKQIYTTNQFDYVAKHLINKVLAKGQDNIDRTKVGTKSIFSEKISIDLSDYSIPITSLKQTPLKNTIRELLWFINGSSNVKHLHSKVKHWWTPWQKNNGDVGNMYGYMMRNYCPIYEQQAIVTPDGEVSYQEGSSIYVDQLYEVIERIKTNPPSRHHVISLWNPNLDAMQLANCHGTHIQFYIEDGKLSMDTYQRSMDFLLGGFVNFTSYAILLHIIAHLTDLKPGILNYGIGDLHIYNTHLKAAEELLIREPIQCDRRLFIDPLLTFDSLMYELSPRSDRDMTKQEMLDRSIDKIVDMFSLVDYKYHKGIKLDIAV